MLRAVAFEACAGGLAHGPARDVVGHERVAVAVAADPASELQERSDLRPSPPVGLGEGLLQRALNLRHHVEQRLVEEVEAPGDLLLHRELLQPQLASQPQHLDLVA